MNTLRFYERIELISPFPREKDNYRRFDVRHLLQMRVVRLVYQEQWPGRTIRSAAPAIIEALREWNVTEADSALIRYHTLIAKELENASAVPSTGEQIIFSRNAASEKRVVLCAHVDTKY